MAQFFDSILHLALNIVPGWNDPTIVSGDKSTSSTTSSSSSSIIRSSSITIPAVVYTAQFERLHGGMTNAVYKLALLNDKLFPLTSSSSLNYPPCTIVRVVNPYLESTIDRKKERKIIQQCASLQISPELYGTCFINGNYDTATQGVLITSTTSPVQSTGENTGETTSGSTIQRSPSTTPSSSSSSTSFSSASSSPTKNNPPGTLSVRFEEYIEGKTLALPDLRNPLLAPYLAQLVVRFQYQEDILSHQPRLLSLLNSTISTTNTIIINDSSSSSSSSSSTTNSTIATTTLPLSSPSNDSVWALPVQYRGYLSSIHDIESSNGYALRKQLWSTTLNQLFDTCNWNEEIQWITQTLLTKQTNKYPFNKYECVLGNTVLSHGDLQEHNWLVKENGRLYLIDYEYSGNNCNGFDIGNLYCEHLCAYGSQYKGAYRFDGYMAYPSIEWQRTFLTNYVLERRKLYGYVHQPTTVSSSIPLEPVIVPSSVTIYAKPDNGTLFSDDISDDTKLILSRKCTSIAPSVLDEVFAPVGDQYDEKFMKEVKEVAIQARVGILASHLYWSLWSIVLAVQQVTPDDNIVTSSAASMGNINNSSTSRSVNTIITTPVSLKDENIQELASPSTSHTFDYAAYGYDRIKEYLRLRKELEEDLRLYEAK